MSEFNKTGFVNDEDEQSKDTYPWPLIATEVGPLNDINPDFGESIEKQLPASLRKYSISSIKVIDYKTNGNFGISYSGEFPNGGKKVFVKVYEAFGKGTEESIVEEIKRHLLGFKNENILKIYGIAPTMTSISLVMELMDGGSLETVIHDNQKNYKGQVESWILQVSLAVAFLHNLKIIHRDIRPANMFLDEKLKVLKLSDFGMTMNLSQVTYPLNPDNRTSLHKRINYLAPELRKEIKEEELLKGKLTFKQRIMTEDKTIFEEESITNEESAYKADVYSEGVTIWEVVNRKRPSTTFDINKPNELSTDSVLAKLLARCLNLDPKEKQITSEEVSKWIGNLPKLRKEEEELQRHENAKEKINREMEKLKDVVLSSKAKQLSNYELEMENEVMKHEINMRKIAMGGSSSEPSTSR